MPIHWLPSQPWLLLPAAGGKLCHIMKAGTPRWLASLDDVGDRFLYVTSGAYWMSGACIKECSLSHTACPMATVDLLGLASLSSSTLEQPLVCTPASPSEYDLTLSGECRTFVMRLPCDMIYDLSDTAKSSLFLYCWIDSERGQGAHVHYCSSALSSSPQGKTAHIGEYSLQLKIRPEELDLLKLMCCIRIKDDATNNYRTDVISTGAMRLDRLLAGREETAILTSVFDPQNHTEVKMKVLNADKFANAQTSLLPENAGGGRRLPTIKFKPSSLWRTGELADLVDLTCDTLKMQMNKCKIKSPAGGEQFLLGKTRWVTQTLVFFSLFLGTPAYTLMPFLAVGSSAEPLSPTVRRRSARSSPIIPL